MIKVKKAKTKSKHSNMSYCQSNNRAWVT